RTADFLLLPNQEEQDQDAGLCGAAAASIGDFVWLDGNGDGIQDAGEGGESGVSVELFLADGELLGSATSGGDGSYRFDGLAAATYYLEFTAPMGMGKALTVQDAGDDAVDSDPNRFSGRTDPFHLSPGEADQDLDAGIVPEVTGAASLGDFVWNDTDGDGEQGATEPGVADITVNLLDSVGNPVGSTVTDAAGAYTFTNLSPGSYELEFVLPDGGDLTVTQTFRFSPQAATGDGTTDSDVDPMTGRTGLVALGVSEDNVDVDAGLVPTVVATVGNLVWRDDGDGIRDIMTEPGLAGATVRLFTASGQDAGVTSTDVNGAYAFDGLAAGDYKLKFDLPAGFTAFSPADQTTDDLDSDADTSGNTVTFKLVRAQLDETWDAGLEGGNLASIGGFVWEDDGDGIQQGSELGLAGVTVNLYSGFEVLIDSFTTTFTIMPADDGFYTFSDLAPGDYFVEFVPPAVGGFIFTLQGQGDGTNDSEPDQGTGRTATFSLAAGASLDTVDAGFVVGVDLGITIDDLVMEAIPGSTNLIYSVTVSNLLGSAAVAPVDVAFLPGLPGISWSCSPSGGATCTAFGTGDIADTVTLPPASSLTYTAAGTADASATGILSVQANVTTPVSLVEFVTSNNTATDADTLTPVLDLAVTKDNGRRLLFVGEAVTYTVTVSNAGPSSPPNVTVADSFPPELAAISWSCSASGGASCGGPDSTDIADSVDIPVGDSVTYTIDTTIADSVASTVSNTADAAVPTGVGATDPEPGNDAATDEDLLGREADLAVSLSGPGTVSTGTALVYTVSVTNQGPSPAGGVSVSAPTPAQLGAPTVGAPCAGGFPCSLATLTSGQVVNFDVTYAVSATYIGPDPIVQTVAVAGDVGDPEPGNNTASSSTAADRPGSADLAVALSGPPSAFAGSSVTWEATVANLGSDDAQTVMLALPTPVGLTFASASAPCTGFPCALGDLNAGATAVVSAVFDIPGGYSGPDPIEATVTVSSSTADPDPSNDSATASAPLGDEPVDLRLSLFGPVQVNAGDDAVFHVGITNLGPATATAVSLSLPTPSGLSFVSADAPCGAGFSCALADLAPGGSRELLATFNIPAGYAGDDPFTIAATITAVQPETDFSDNTDARLVGVSAEVADVAIVKSGPLDAVAGSTVTYTLAVSNLGPGPALSVLLSDPEPADLTFASASSPCSAGFPCDLGDLGAGSSLAVNVVFDVVLDPTAPVTNVATVSTGSTDPDGSNDSSTHEAGVDFKADLSIVKSAPMVAVPNELVTYTLVVENSGPSAADSTTVTDVFPSGLLNVTWTCSASGGAACAAGGSGNIAELVNIPPATGSLTFTAMGIADPTSTLILDNTATVAAPVGTTDPFLANNIASTITEVSDDTDLEITKDDGLGSVAPGDPVVYSIVVRNLGPAPIVGATVYDAFPAALIGVSWSCGATGGSCSQSGSGDIVDTVNLLAGGLAEYVAAAIVDPAASGTITNTATVTLPGGIDDPNLPNNSSTDVTEIGTPIFEDGFESGDTSAWSLTVGAAAPIQVVLGDPEREYTVLERVPGNHRELAARMQLDLSSLVIGEAERHPIVVAASRRGKASFELEMKRLGGFFWLRLRVAQDDGSWLVSDWSRLNGPEPRLELRWWTSKSAGGTDGGASLWIDDSLAVEVLGADNYSRRSAWLRFVSTDAVGPKTRGSYAFDKIEWRH
ncbi:MAG: SdrD B-like domain-containing protein, partial [Thermoanaerobaculia bacterium]